MERVDKNKKRVPFSIGFVKMSTGEVVHGKEVVCTSSNNGDGSPTVNIMFLPSMEIRKIHIISVIQFNEHTVYF